MNPQPMPITINTIETLVMTMTLLTKADSAMPRISSAVSKSQDDESAGMLMMPCTPSARRLER